MKKAYKITCLCFITSSLVACASSENTTSNKNEPEKSSISMIAFESGQELLEESPSEKKATYESLDQIRHTDGSLADQMSFSQIQAITSEEELAQLMKASDQEPFILYLGFDECPYCKVFSPKINQLASELDVTLHYYNTHTFDATALADKLGIETVPHAFIIKDGKPVEFVNQNSDMQELEDFLRDFKAL